MHTYVTVRYIHMNGDRITEEINASAFYSLLRAGNLLSDMELVLSVHFPPPANSTWCAPSADREEQIVLLRGLMKPYFDRGD